MFGNIYADISNGTGAAERNNRKQQLVFSGVSYFDAVEFLGLSPRKGRELMLSGGCIPGSEAGDIGRTFQDDNGLADERCALCSPRLGDDAEGARRRDLRVAGPSRRRPRLSVQL
jgi:hypothetical protein